MPWLSEFFRAVAEVFGFVNKRTDLKNQPAVVKAAEANQENRAVDESAKAVKERNEDQIRKELSE
jgi:hypothetical protein